jgi:hypothetical protein
MSFRKNKASESARVLLHCGAALISLTLSAATPTIFHFIAPRRQPRAAPEAN